MTLTSNKRANKAEGQWMAGCRRSVVSKETIYLKEEYYYLLND